MLPRTRYPHLKSSRARGGRNRDDVHITKDGHIVICHNDTVDEMSNGTGAIGDYMFDDIRKLDFGSKFSKDFAGVTLPTVEEYLECMKKSDKLSVMNIEIKPNKSEREDIVRKTIDAVKDYGLLMSFSFRASTIRCLLRRRSTIPSARRRISIRFTDR